MSKIIIIALAVTVGLIALFSRQANTENAEKPLSSLELSSKQSASQESKVEKLEAINQVFPWSELGIKPMETLEGDHYVLTAFDYDHKNNELIIAGSYEKNTLSFIKDGKINEIEVSDVPLDVLTHNETLYILCLNKFIVMKDKNIIKEIEHNIKDVTSFDKMLFFDGFLNILMSEGSSFKYTDGGFSYSKSLLTGNGEEIWVQKTTSNSFEIKSDPNSETLNKKVTYNNEIGSITLLGEQSTKYYCIVDVIQNTTPISARRDLKSSKDNFQKTVLELPRRSFSFIKNDIRIHNNIVYTVTISEESLTLNTTLL